MIIFGASGHGKVVLDILLSNNIKVDFILDDKPDSTELLGIDIVKADDVDVQQEAIIAIGNNETRKNISKKYLFTYKTAIDPKATVSKFANIEVGTVVMANAVINPNAKIGKHCIVNTSSVIEHDCIVRDFVHISPGASLAGNVTIEEGAHIGIGASIIQGVKIGQWAIVGAGAVVIKDVPDFATVVGNPTRIIK